MMDEQQKSKIFLFRPLTLSALIQLIKEAEGMNRWWSCIRVESGWRLEMVADFIDTEKEEQLRAIERG